MGDLRINRMHKMADKVNFVEDVLFLNGISRAGKFLLGKIVSCLETVEYFQYASILEQLPFLVNLDFITENAALALFRVNVDEHAYNMAIGRNLNFRFTDASSLYNSPDFNKYLDRSLSSNIPNLLDKFKSEKRLPCFIVHEILSDAKFLCKAFSGTKIIDLQRHPVDLVSSWFKRGWGNRYGEDPLAFIPVLKGVNGGVPWYANSWKDEYENLAPIDRVITSVAFLIEAGEKSCSALTSDERQRMLRITYEELIEDTFLVVEKISSFLGVAIKESLLVVTQREKVPHKISLESRKEKWAELEKIASMDKLETLSNLSKRYEAEFF